MVVCRAVLVGVRYTFVRAVVVAVGWLCTARGWGGRFRVVTLRPWGDERRRVGLMIDVTSAWWHGALIALAAGAFGGVLAELVLNRKGSANWLEMPTWPYRRGSSTVRGRFIQTGVFGRVVVGAGAGLIFLAAYGPDSRVVPAVGDVPASTVKEYNAYLLIGLTAAVGSAGAAVIAAFGKAVTSAAESFQVRALVESFEETRALAARLAAEPDKAVELVTDDDVNVSSALLARLDLLGKQFDALGGPDR